MINYSGKERETSHIVPSLGLSVQCQKQWGIQSTHHENSNGGKLALLLDIKIDGFYHTNTGGEASVV